METERGWGMLCGSWMGVDGECVCSWMGNGCVRGYRLMGVYGEWRMDVLDESRIEET